MFLDMIYKWVIICPRDFYHGGKCLAQKMWSYLLRLVQYWVSCEFFHTLAVTNNQYPGVWHILYAKIDFTEWPDLLKSIFSLTHTKLFQVVAWLWFWYRCSPTKSERKRELQKIWAFWNLASIRAGIKKASSSSRFLAKIVISNIGFKIDAWNSHDINSFFQPPSLREYIRSIWVLVQHGKVVSVNFKSTYDMRYEIKNKQIKTTLPRILSRLFSSIVADNSKMGHLNAALMNFHVSEQ